MAIQATKKGAFKPPFLNNSLDKLFDLGTLADSAAQIVELGAANLTASDGLDGDDRRRMDGENFLASDTVGNAANGDSLGDPAVLLGDDSAVESLVALTVAFLNAYGDTDSVAHVHLRQLGLHVLLGKCFYQIHNKILLSIRRSYRYTKSAADRLNKT